MARQTGRHALSPNLVRDVGERRLRVQAETTAVGDRIRPPKRIWLRTTPDPDSGSGLLPKCNGDFPV